MRGLGLVIIIALALTAADSSAEPYSVIFDRGNGFYTDGEYAQAINEYQKILVAGFESSELYFNLGNAYFRDGQLGRAIINYIRAKRLSPRDDDIQANLDFAKKHAVDKIEVTESTIIFNYINDFFDSFSLNEITALAFVFYLLTVLAILVKYAYKIIYIPNPIFVILCVLLAITSIFTVVKIDRDILTRQGVVIADEVDIKNGPSGDFDTKFTAHAGLVFKIESEETDYYWVSFENKFKGWIRKGAVDEI